MSNRGKSPSRGGGVGFDEDRKQLEAQLKEVHKQINFMANELEDPQRWIDRANGVSTDILKGFKILHSSTELFFNSLLLFSNGVFEPKR